MKASEHKVDKGKLSRTLKLNLESLIQQGSDSTECLKVTCNREGTLFQRNCPVCQDKKETYTDQRREQWLQSTTKGEAAKQIISGKGDEEGHTFLPSLGQKRSPL